MDWTKNFGKHRTWKSKMNTPAMEEINSGKYHTVIADPEFDKILSRDDVRLIGLPHLAVSSKLHWDEYPDYLGEELKQLVESAAEGAK